MIPDFISEPFLRGWDAITPDIIAANQSQIWQAIIETFIMVGVSIIAAVLVLILLSLLF